MWRVDDTIVAIATPAGRSAIGVVRLTGPQAPAIATTLLGGVVLQPRLATVCMVAVSGAEPGVVSQDEAVAVWFSAPKSYTGEHVVEISTHGNPVVLEGVVRGAQQAGARLARRGEFTFRAVLNGKLTLVEAEAVADLIDASTLAQARVAFDQLQGTLTDRIRGFDAELFDLIARLEASLDFPDEGYHFAEEGEVQRVVEGLRRQVATLLADAPRARLLRDGATVAIVGRPNVGKSSLFNALIGGGRAIVTSVPGTTRDLLTERVEVGGLVVTLVDTAGVRETRDPVEREGVARSAQARRVADLVIVVLDATAGLTTEDASLLDGSEAATLRVWNKADLVAQRDALDGVVISALTGEGIGRVRLGIAEVLIGREPIREGPAVGNLRHIALLKDVDVVLGRASELAASGAPEEILLHELREVRKHLDELQGVRTAEDVLARIFDRFCIGK